MNLAELKAVALAATPGPWHVEDDDRPGMSWNRHIMSAPNKAVCFMAHSNGRDDARDNSTARHIAAFNPEVALKLITAVEAARPAMEAMEEAITYTSSPVWSPSLTKECESALSGLRVALEAVEKS
jgi:hypothetical protein